MKDYVEEKAKEVFKSFGFNGGPVTYEDCKKAVMEAFRKGTELEPKQIWNSPSDLPDGDGVLDNRNILCYCKDKDGAEYYEVGRWTTPFKIGWTELPPPPTKDELALFEVEKAIDDAGDFDDVMELEEERQNILGRIYGI